LVSSVITRASNPALERSTLKTRLGLGSRSPGQFGARIIVKKLIFNPFTFPCLTLGTLVGILTRVEEWGIYTIPSAKSYLRILVDQNPAGRCTSGGYSERGKSAGELVYFND